MPRLPTPTATVIPDLPQQRAVRQRRMHGSRHIIDAGRIEALLHDQQR